MQILLLAALAATIQPGLPALPSGASNSSPVPMQPLRPGEVLLEVNAVGKATHRADTAQVTVNVTGTGTGRPTPVRRRMPRSNGCAAWRSQPGSTHPTSTTRARRLR